MIAATSARVAGAERSEAPENGRGSSGFLSGASPRSAHACLAAKSGNALLSSAPHDPDFDLSPSPLVFPADADAFFVSALALLPAESVEDFWSSPPAEVLFSVSALAASL